MSKTKDFLLAVAIAAMAFTVSCSSTKFVTKDLREGIETTTSMNDPSLTYYLDRDIEMKASQRSISTDKAGSGISQSVQKDRTYLLIKEGTGGKCKDVKKGLLGISFEPDRPDALLYFVLDDGTYKLYYGENSVAANDETYRLYYGADGMIELYYGENSVAANDETYRLYYGADGMIVYEGMNFQVQKEPTYWWNKFLTIFSGSGNGLDAKLKLKYNLKESESVRTRKAKGYD